MDAAVDEDYGELRAELEIKFDELFILIDDEDG